MLPEWLWNLTWPEALQDSSLALTKQVHDLRHSGPATARYPHPLGSGPSAELSLCLCPFDCMFFCLCV